MEFKRDGASGKWFLIEVNPRHWDQHEVGAHIGVNLSWIAYQHMIGRPTEDPLPGRKITAQFKWIAETEALMLILQNAYFQMQENRRLKLSFPERLRHHFETFKTSFRETAFLLKGRKVFAYRLAARRA